MTNNNDKKKNSSWEGVKKGTGLVVGTVGFFLGDPVGAAAGFKIGVGAGALGGAS